MKGISTRKVGDLVQALGMPGISKSQVSRLCAELDERVEAFLSRPLSGSWPYLWLDATYLKSRQNGPVQSKAAVVAVGVNAEGRRETLGMAVGLSLFDASVTVGSVDVKGNGAYRAIDQATADTDGGFTRFNLSLSRLQQLTEHWSVYARVTADSSRRPTSTARRSSTSAAPFRCPATPWARPGATRGSRSWRNCGTTSCCPGPAR